MMFLPPPWKIRNLRGANHAIRSRDRQVHYFVFQFWFEVVQINTDYLDSFNFACTNAVGGQAQTRQVPGQKLIVVCMWVATGPAGSTGLEDCVSSGGKQSGQ
jgi:hypothetical protein